MSPYAILYMWMFSILMAGAIAIGPAAIYAVGGVLIAYSIVAVMVSS
ncbi:hypothetical protein [Mycobacterium intracellulare]|nr:hypothetical protein [Mycobacterium intracellulare]